MIEIIPTVVPKAFEDVQAARKRYGAFAPTIHVDAVDGLFAPNKTWLPLSGEKFPDSGNIAYEAHLMIENPCSLGLSFARAGARRIIGHIEAFKNAESARETFNMWQRAGIVEVGVAMLFATPLQELAAYAEIVDFVHVMTIAEIGKQGFAFEEKSIERISAIRTRFPHMVISTDGGVTAENIDDLARAGASRFCIGTALAKAKDSEKEYARLAAAVEVGTAVK